MVNTHHQSKEYLELAMTQENFKCPEILQILYKIKLVLLSSNLTIRHYQKYVLYYHIKYAIFQDFVMCMVLTRLFKFVSCDFF